MLAVVDQRLPPVESTRQMAEPLPGPRTLLLGVVGDIYTIDNVFELGAHDRYLIGQAASREEAVRRQRRGRRRLAIAPKAATKP